MAPLAALVRIKILYRFVLLDLINDVMLRLPFGKSILMDLLNSWVSHKDQDTAYAFPFRRMILFAIINNVIMLFISARLVRGCGVIPTSLRKDTYRRRMLFVLLPRFARGERLCCFLGFIYVPSSVMIFSRSCFGRRFIVGFSSVERGSFEEPGTIVMEILRISGDYLH